jgi:hypothetical protein
MHVLLLRHRWAGSRRVPAIFCLPCLKTLAIFILLWSLQYKDTKGTDYQRSSHTGMTMWLCDVSLAIIGIATWCFCRRQHGVFMRTPASVCVNYCYERWWIKAWYWIWFVVWLDIIGLCSPIVFIALLVCYSVRRWPIKASPTSANAMRGPWTAVCQIYVEESQTQAVVKWRTKDHPLW